MANSSGESASESPFEGMQARAPLHRILFIDDDTESVRETKRVLESRGFNVSVAKDAGQAQSAIRISPPDFVLLQVILPSESGFEICERIKQQCPKLPVMMLTEVDLDSARNLAQRVGADGYLTKPYAPDVLGQMLRQIADAVFERVLESKKEKGVVRFRCRCGRKIKERYENRGKYITCSDCSELAQVPNQSIHEFFTHHSETGITSSDSFQPLRFITVKCQQCATFYRLSTTRTDWRNCPRCGTTQTGSLSIVGAPISRAALESSLRVLRVLNGKNKGKKLLLPQREVTFGNAADCTVRNTSRTISAHHCTLQPSAHGILVKDLGSEHGTFINGDRLSPDQEQLLRPGAVLRIGKFQFRLIGEDTTIEEEVQRIQSWSMRQDKAQQKGIRLIEAGHQTAAEAAQVIQQYWNITRMKNAADAPPRTCS